MVTTLVTMGREAAPAVMAVFGRTRGDDHWRLRLLEVLGRLRHPAVPPFLLKVGKSDPLQPMRAQAFLSLARHGNPKLIDQLKTIRSRFHPQKHQPELLALGYAIAALGDRETGEKILRDHFILPPTPTKFRRWDRLRPGVYAIGQLRMRDLRPALEDIADRADPFVRREAIKSLSALRDRAALPAIALRLDDDVPGVRMAAVNALQTLTGYYNLKTPQQWRRWWRTEQKRGDSSERMRPPSRALSSPSPVPTQAGDTKTAPHKNIKNAPKPALN